MGLQLEMMGLHKEFYEQECAKIKDAIKSDLALVTIWIGLVLEPSSFIEFSLWLILKHFLRECESAKVKKIIWMKEK